MGMEPSVIPSMEPSVLPSIEPSVLPSTLPSVVPSMKPSVLPSLEPSLTPSSVQSFSPLRPNYPTCYLREDKKKCRKNDKCDWVAGVCTGVTCGEMFPPDPASQDACNKFGCVWDGTECLRRPCSEYNESEDACRYFRCTWD